MLSVLDNYTLDNPDEIAKEIANDFRKRRIEKNLTERSPFAVYSIGWQLWRYGNNLECGCQ